MLARMAGIEVPLGAHVERVGVLDAAQELTPTACRSSSPTRAPGASHLPSRGRRDPRQRDRDLRARALPDQRLLAEAERPLRLAQDPPADLRRGERDRCPRGDRPRRPRRGRHRRRARALVALARAARDRRHGAAREHRRGRERRRPALRRARAPLGSDRRGRARDRPRLLLRHLPRPRRRRGAGRRGRTGARDHGPDRPPARQRLPRPGGDRSRPPRAASARARSTSTPCAG